MSSLTPQSLLALEGKEEEDNEEEEEEEKDEEEEEEEASLPLRPS